MKTGLVLLYDELDDCFADQLIRAGVQVVGLHPGGGETALEDLGRTLQYVQGPAFQARIRRLHEAGIETEYAVHAAAWLLPREEFARHPEWFRMNENGERTPDKNLCFSNPEALELLARNTVRLSRLLPSSNGRYHFWMDDAASGMCHCERCRAMNPADQILTAVNRMVRELRREQPEATLSFLAYHDTLCCPQGTPESGVFLEVAPMDRDYHRPLDDAACDKNRRQTGPFAPLLDKFGRRNSTALDYWMDNSLFSEWKRPPRPFVLDEATLRADGALYRRLGFEYVTSFGCYLGADYRALYGENPPLEAYVRGLTQD